MRRSDQKSSNPPVVKLTELENEVVETVLNAVKDNLSFETDTQNYQECHDDWILSLEKDEYLALGRALKKVRGW